LVKNHKNFTEHCEANFEAKSLTYGTDKNKIVYARQFLEGTLKEDWKRYEKGHGLDRISWEKFKELTLDWMDTPANRRIDAARKYEEANQGTLNVRSFANFLESLEDRLPSYTEEQRMTHLLAKLRPDLQRRILLLEGYKSLHTRQDLVEAASTIEEGVRKKKQEKEQKQQGHRPARNVAGSRRPDPNKPPQDQSPITQTNPGNRSSNTSGPSTGPNNLPVRSQDRSRSTDPNKLQCFHCQGFGHIKSNCPQLDNTRNTAAASRDRGKG
jgi:hypothetical protein